MRLSLIAKYNMLSKLLRFSEPFGYLRLTSGTSPQVTGTDAILLNLVPLFYILVLIIVPAVIAYKIYKEWEGVRYGGKS